jgi:hypothetical protein
MKPPTNRKERRALVTKKERCAICGSRGMTADDVCIIDGHKMHGECASQRMAAARAAVRIMNREKERGSSV